MAAPEQESLFRGLLDAYIARRATHPLAGPDSEFPPREWPGWAAICEDVGVSADYPAFRVRQAVKITIDADSDNLRGRDVDFPAIEAKLEGILLGTVLPEALPYTQAPEEAAMAAAAAGEPVIVMAERGPLNRGRRAWARFMVAFPAQSQDMGEWFTKKELQDAFPDRWKAMVKGWTQYNAAQNGGGGAGAGAAQVTADETATAGDDAGEVEAKGGGAGGRPEDHQASVVEGQRDDADLFAAALAGGGRGGGMPLHVPAAAFPVMEHGQAPFFGPSTGAAGLQPMTVNLDNPSFQFIPAQGQHLAAGVRPAPLPEPMAFTQQPYLAPPPAIAAPPPRLPPPQQPQFIAPEVPVQAGVWAPEPAVIPVAPPPQPLQQRQPPAVAPPQPRPPAAPKPRFVPSMIGANLEFLKKNDVDEEPAAVPAAARAGHRQEHRRVPPPTARPGSRQSRMQITEEDIDDLLGSSGGAAPAQPAAAAAGGNVAKPTQGRARDPRLRTIPPTREKAPAPAAAAAAAASPGSALGKRAAEAKGAQAKRQKTEGATLQELAQQAEAMEREEEEREARERAAAAAAGAKGRRTRAHAAEEGEEEEGGPRRSRRVQKLERGKEEALSPEKRQQREKQDAAAARVEAALAAQAAQYPLIADAAEHEAAAAREAAAAGGELDARMGPEQWQGVRIEGAKTYPDREGIHILLKWSDEFGAVVPSRDLQMPGRAHCMRTLIAFFESKIKKRAKGEGGTKEAAGEGRKMAEERHDGGTRESGGVGAAVKAETEEEELGPAAAAKSRRKRAAAARK